MTTAIDFKNLRPETFDEAVRVLHAFFFDAAKQDVRNAESAAQLGAITHHGLGRSIRNEWGLWAGGPLKDDMERLGFVHPDDMSSAILRRFFCEVRGEPYDLAADVARYRAFWDNAAANSASPSKV